MSLVSPDSKRSVSRTPTTLSTKTSHKRYSVRSQVLARKRQAERDQSGENTEDSDEDIRPERKRLSKNRSARLSPSPASPGLRSDLFSADTATTESSSITTSRPGSSTIQDEGALEVAGKPDPARNHGASGSYCDSNSRKESSLASAPSTPPRQLRRLPSGNSIGGSSPRDLSGFFSPSVEDSPESRTSSSIPKLKRATSSRRMLTKAQSLGEHMVSPSARSGSPTSPNPFPTSAPRTPSRTPIKTQSMPITPSKELSTASIVRDRFPTALPNADLPRSGGRAKRTYGGNRTILIDETSNVSREDVADSAEERKTYAELRHRYDVDNEGWDTLAGMEASLVDIAQARAPQPVADMRSKGENRRFLDELGYLVDGLNESNASITMRRASSLDLLKNMQNDAWTAKLHTCGQTERVWDALMKARGDGDSITDFAIILFFAICVRCSVSLDPVLQGHCVNAITIVAASLRADSCMDVTLKSNIPAARTLKIYCQRLTSSREATIDDMRLMVVEVLSSLCKSEYTHRDLPSVNVAIDELLSNIAIATRENMASSTRLRYLDIGLAILAELITNIPTVVAEYADSSENKAGDLVSIIESFVSAVNTREEDGEFMAINRVLDTLQILAFFAKSSPRFAAAVLQSATGPPVLLSILKKRSLLSQGLVSNLKGPVESNRQMQPTATDEDILCLVLAIFASGLHDGLVNTIGHIGKPSALLRGTLPVTAASGVSDQYTAKERSLTESLCHLFQEYSKQDSNTNTIIRGYLALVIVNIWYKEVDQRKSVAEVLSEGRVSETLRKLDGALRELLAIESRMDEVDGEGENVVIEKALEMMVEMQVGD